MDLPKKIENDHLVETIAAVRFVPSDDSNSALWPGLLMPPLKEEGYTYIPIRRNKPADAATDAEPVVDAELPEVSMFANLDFSIRVLIEGNTVSFNYMAGHYGGWDQYAAQIERVLAILSNAGVAGAFDRAMVRYISEYPEVDVLQHIKPQLSVADASGFVPQEVTFTRNDDGARAFVAVSSMLPRRNSDGSDEHLASLFDVTVYRNVEGDRNAPAALRALATAHRLEKKCFFELLQPDFLQSLKPVY